MIKLNISKAYENEKVEGYLAKAKEKLETLKSGTLDMTGWVNLPINYDKEEFKRIQEVSLEIYKNANLLIIIGIGGSYLGAKAGIDFLSHYYENKGIEVLFAGNGLSERYLKETLDYAANKDFYINVISKSGGTLEPSVAFNKFRELCEAKYGENGAKTRIIATTDARKGILKEEADKKGYRTFVVPDDIGGRYSVMSSVGLLPIASAGYDIDKIMLGARNAMNKYLNEDVNNNDVVKYAVLRNILYDKGKVIEVFSTFSPNMRMFAEWLKQLFGESECKENKGIFPSSLNMTADLHSMGQLMQQGMRNMFETFITVEDDYCDERINYNELLTVNDLNNIAKTATEKAHFDGNVPVIDIKIEKQNEETLGELFYFFELACGISALILGVNPFNQPGVEEYKKNIKELLK